MDIKDCDKLQQEKIDLIKFLEAEKERLAIEVSHMYEDSFGNIRYVNEDIFEEVCKILGKLRSD